jgi:DNA-binding GntR family transcriptional regulator
MTPNRQDRGSSSRSHKASLKHDVYEGIRADIIEGSVLPGDLLKERELAEVYGVSKTPVREALALLEQESLVQSIPRAGYMVTQPSLSDLQDLYQLRLALETTAIRLAAENISEQDLARLEEIAFTSDPEKARAHNREFHSLVAWASGNSRLARIVDQLLDEMDRWAALDLRSLSVEVLLIGHRRELEALKTRDPDLAEQVMRDRIQTLYQHLFKSFR